MDFLISKGEIPKIEILFDTTTNNKVSVKKENENAIEFPLFRADDMISGRVHVSIGKGGNYRHQGIQIELIGNIESSFDKGKIHKMLRIKKELEPVGELSDNRIYQFCFDKFEKPSESYYGTHLTLRYFLRVTIITSKFQSNITQEKDFAMHLATPAPERIQVQTMEAGIEDCFHIEYSYNKDKYHLKDCIVGQIYFTMVRLRIVKTELFIVRRELYGFGPNMQMEDKNIARIQLADYCPKTGETMPFRCYLGGYDLTPSFRNNIASVKYYLNLVWIDDDDRRYFQRMEIFLWRKE